MIQFYKKYVSPMWLVIFGLSFGCRFHPTCSAYGQQAVKQLGIVRGSIKTLYRVVKCNPFSRGGVDFPT